MVDPIRTTCVGAAFVSLTPEQAAGKSLSDHFDEVLGSVQNKRDQWSATPPERGQIDGIPFLRVHWTGVGRPVARKALGGRQMQGFIYVGLAGSLAIINASAGRGAGGRGNAQASGSSGPDVARMTQDPHDHCSG